MTFTDEPSIIIPGRFSLRIEDIVVCDEGGGRKLNAYPAALVANLAHYFGDTCVTSIEYTEL